MNPGAQPFDAGLSSPTPSAAVSSLDDVLHRIAAEIEDISSKSGGVAPVPVVPDDTAVDPELPRLRLLKLR